MSPTLVLLHTTAATLPLMRELAPRWLPGVELFNLLDDSLLAEVIRNGGVTAGVERRIRAYVEQAHVLGGTAVLSCCSSIGEAVEAIAPSAPLPFWRIDEAMAEEAVRRAERIRVVGTVQTTLAPTSRLIERVSREMQRTVSVAATLIDGAFAALQAGDTADHDRRVEQGLRALVGECDLVVLAQASTARVAAALPSFPLPILTSPELGLARARERLRELEAVA